MSAAEKPAALALVPQQSSAAMTVTGNIRISNMHEAIELAGRLAGARGFVPAALAGNGAAVLAAILTGAELGMGPMEAMRSLHIIEGKPTMAAEVMLARAHRAGHRTKWVSLGDNGTATLRITLAGQTTPEADVSFTRREAEAAGLAGKGNWKKHEAAMLRARATSACIRAHCPEVLGAGVYESESGEITDGIPSSDMVQATVVSQTTPPAQRSTEAPRVINDCQTPDHLRAWLATEAAKTALKTHGLQKFTAIVLKHAERVCLDVAEVDALITPPNPVAYDPETGEVAPEHEPA